RFTRSDSAACDGRCPAAPARSLLEGCGQEEAMTDFETLRGALCRALAHAYAALDSRDQETCERALGSTHRALANIERNRTIRMRDPQAFELGILLARLQHVLSALHRAEAR